VVLKVKAIAHPPQYVAWASVLIWRWWFGWRHAALPMNS
jgi:hypothetical protein